MCGQRRPHPRWPGGPGGPAWWPTTPVLCNVVSQASRQEADAPSQLTDLPGLEADLVSRFDRETMCPFSVRNFPYWESRLGLLGQDERRRREEVGCLTEAMLDLWLTIH